MKNYETGICVHCGKKKVDHDEVGTCDDLFQDGNGNYVPQCFKDSGIAQLEANAPKLLRELTTNQETIFDMAYHLVMDPKYKNWQQARKVLMERFAIVKIEAINEALKLE